MIKDLRIKQFIISIIGEFLVVLAVPSRVFAVPVDISKEFGYGGFKSLGEATSQLVTPAFSVAATLVSLYFIIGAYDYIKSGSDKEALSKARRMITHSIIGFIFLIFSFLVLQFLPNFFDLSGQDVIR